MSGPPHTRSMLLLWTEVSALSAGMISRSQEPAEPRHDSTGRQFEQQAQPLLPQGEGVKFACYKRQQKASSSIDQRALSYQTARFVTFNLLHQPPCLNNKLSSLLY